MTRATRRPVRRRRNLPAGPETPAGTAGASGLDHGRVAVEPPRSAGSRLVDHQRGDSTAGTGVPPTASNGPVPGSARIQHLPREAVDTFPLNDRAARGWSTLCIRSASSRYRTAPGVLLPGGPASPGDVIVLSDQAAVVQRGHHGHHGQGSDMVAGDGPERHRSSVVAMGLGNCPLDISASEIDFAPR